jgi:hypothetical protein
MFSRLRRHEDRRIKVVRRHDCAHGIQALLAVKKLASRLAIPVHVSDVIVQTEEEARAELCLGSPTVLIDGRDVEPSARGLTAFGAT